MVAPAYREVVILVPGFLGFARFGTFYYFDERMIAGLRMALEERRGARVPVIPWAPLPTSGLLERQRHLSNYLRRLLQERISGVERLHLVGHSSGGVDAVLLACRERLSGEPWGRDDAVYREKLASVTTLAAPHHGTGLAASLLAAALENPLGDPSAVLSQARVVARLLKSLPREMPEAAGMQAAHARDIARFAWQVFRNRRLIQDLRPDRMEEVRQRVVLTPGVRITCFVAGAEPRASGRPSEAFYRELYALTADETSLDIGPMDPATRSLAEWMARPGEVICSPESILPRTIDAQLSDGVVNSARQLLDPSDASQFGGFVVADHADILGHYDRQDALIEGDLLEAGLLHSGAGFGDDEFFSLLHRIADAMR